MEEAKETNKSFYGPVGFLKFIIIRDLKELFPNVSTALQIFICLAVMKTVWLIVFLPQKNKKLFQNSIFQRQGR